MKIKFSDGSICELLDTEGELLTVKDIKRQYSEQGKVLGACSYDGNFYPRFNYEKCPFVDDNRLVESN